MSKMDEPGKSPTMFKDKTILITGGTGSFGNVVLERFLNTDIKEIRIFSRDEKNKMICVHSIKMTRSNFLLEMCGILIV